MRQSLLFFSLIAILTACAPGGSKPESIAASNMDFAEGTGFHANNGAPYSNAGDPRVAPMVQKLSAAANNPVVRKQILFLQTLEAFKFERLDKGDDKQKRFGKDSFVFQAQRKGESGHSEVITCKGGFSISGQTFSLANTTCDTPGYQLYGAFTDGDDSSIGQFHLHTDGQQAVIFFRAYKAHASVRTDSSQDLSQAPKLQAKIDELKKTTYWWVSNYVVPMGVSRFHYDVLQFAEGQNTPITPPLTSFTEDAVQTGEVTAPPAQIDDGNGIDSVELEGESYHDDRAFSVYLHDEDGKATEVMIDMDRDAKTDPPPPPPPKAPAAPVKPVPQKTAPTVTPATPHPPSKPANAKPVPMPHEIVHPTGEAPDAEPQAVPETIDETPRTSQATPNAPAATAATAVAASTKPAPSPAVPSGLIGVTARSYFPTDYNNSDLSRTKKVIDDWEKNFDMSEVQKFYQQFQHGRSQKMKNFYQYMFPLRSYVDSIAAAYDFPPAFAMVILVESGKFINGTYTMEPAYGSSAWGPFQMMWGTAKANNMQFVVNNPPNKTSYAPNPGPHDERNYFVTAACGAANYLHNISSDFARGDTTLAFMGYNQGPAAAAGIAHVRKLGSNFSYDFATIARKHMAAGSWISYVAEILGAYFVSGDPEAHGYDLSDRNTRVPKNAVPPFTIHDPTCRAAVNGTVLASDIEKP